MNESLYGADGLQCVWSRDLLEPVLDFLALAQIALVNDFVAAVYVGLNEHPYLILLDAEGDANMEPSIVATKNLEAIVNFPDVLNCGVG